MKRLAEHRLGQMGEAEAGDIAILVLGFLTQDDERLDRFLTLSGLDRRDVAGQYELTSFRLAVLDYLASDEALLLSFAKYQSLNPTIINNARRALGGLCFD